MKIQNFLCKNCRKESRANGSSRCIKCSTEYKGQQFETERLQRKLQEKITTQLTK